MESPQTKPMMDREEIDLISEILKIRLKGQARALEFGCGGSTIFFSRLARTWVTIEHNKDWAQKAATSLPKSSSVEILVQPPEFPHTGWSPAKEGQFAGYLSSAGDRCPDGGYDFVLVDGRARIDCILELHRAGLMRNGGIVVLHDFRRNRYLVRLNEVLDTFDLTSALTQPHLRGIGVFEYRGAQNKKAPFANRPQSDRHE